MVRKEGSDSPSKKIKVSDSASPAPLDDSVAPDSPKPETVFPKYVFERAENYQALQDLRDYIDKKKALCEDALPLLPPGQSYASLRTDLLRSRSSLDQETSTIWSLWFPW